MESIVSALTEIVPQITYDIIGRFVPGTIVIFSWAAIRWSTLDHDLSDKLLAASGGWLILLFLFVAYIASIVLYGVWMLIDKTWTLTIDRIWKQPRALLNKQQESDKEFLFSVGLDLESGLKQKCLSDDFRHEFRSHGISLSYNITIIEPKKKNNPWQINDIDLGQTYFVEKSDEALTIVKRYPSESLMYDAIRVKSPAVGARLVKLRAEVRQAQVLIVGWGIALILNFPLRLIVKLDSSLGIKLRDDFTERILLDVALVVSIIGLYLFRWRIKGKYVTSVKNHWRILQLDQEPWFTPPSDDQDDQPEHCSIQLYRELVSSK